MAARTSDAAASDVTFSSRRRAPDEDAKPKLERSGWQGNYGAGHAKGDIFVERDAQQAVVAVSVALKPTATADEPERSQT
jgi:hypothetical protein